MVGVGEEGLRKEGFLGISFQFGDLLLFGLWAYLLLFPTTIRLLGPPLLGLLFLLMTMK